MAATRIPANFFRLEVNTGSTGSPTWVEVKGLTSLDTDLSATSVDGSTFDGDGWSDDVVVRRARSVTINGRSFIDESTGAFDAGQAELITLAGEFGSAAVGDFRIVKPGSKADRFSASVGNLKPYGGGKDDLSNFSVTLSVQGNVTEETVA